MTKEQFLNDLNSYLSVLQPEDRKNTIEFYEEYFEDAENDETAIEELGSPKKLADEIINFHKEAYKNEHKEICKQFSESENISEIVLNITAAQVVINTSEEAESIEYSTQNIAEDDFSAKLENGKLIIKEKPVFFFSKKGFISFLENFNINTSFGRAVKRKISISIPKNILLERIEFNSQMGSIETKDVNSKILEGYTTCGNLRLSCGKYEEINFNTSAGLININDANIKNIKLSSSAGSIKLENIKAEKISASTGVGAIDFINTESLYVKANSGAGNINADVLKIEKGNFNTGAGSNKFIKSELSNSSINTGAGGIKFQGILSNNVRINSAIGSIELNLSNKLEDYDIRIYSNDNTANVNGETIKGNSKNFNLGNTEADTNLKISTTLGKIKINTNVGE